MNQKDYPNLPVKIKMIFAEKKTSSEGENLIVLSDLSSLLYDINLLYEFLTLLSIEEYRDYSFHGSFFFRNSKPIKSNHKMHLGKINHNSPLTIELIIPLAAAACGIPWLLLQAIEKLRNWRLNREVLELQAQNLRIQNSNLRLIHPENALYLNKKIEQRNAGSTFQGINNRLEKDNLFATEIEINPMIDEF